MRVVVIGAGIGGLTAALTFHRFGIDTLLFEKASALREIGAGIMLSPNATRILNRLGLEEALRGVGVRPKARRSYRWADGRILSSTPLADVCDRTFGAPYYNLYRGELLDVLTKALAEGVLYLNHRCVGLVQHSDRVEIRFQNGFIADADVLVGADGIHSFVASAIGGTTSPRFSGDIAYRAMVPVARVEDLGIDLDFSNWQGPGRHLTHFLVDHDEPHVNIVASFPGDWRAEQWTQAGSVTEWLNEFAGWDARLLGLIEAADVTTRWALHDIDPRPHWSSGRVTLLGDAAHAMMPYMAQGAVQAIEDAAVLGLCLSRADRKDVSKALVRYEQIRMPRTTQCQVGSRRSQAMFHLPDGEEQRLRDASYASGAVGSIASQAWLYGHDVEAEFEDG